MILHFIKGCRPSQWTKNLVVFAGLVFARKVGDPTLIGHAVLAFILFSFLSSSVYLVNDILDREKDRSHPEKRHRPIASGALPVSVAAVGAGLLMITSLVLGFRLAVPFGITLALYFSLNLLYSLRLKEVVILDVLIISVGFVLRAIGGVEALSGYDDVIISSWLLVCTFFLSLLLGLCKRRCEVALLGADAARHRPVLGDYSLPFVDGLIHAVAAATMIAYSIYTIWPDTVEKFGTERLVYTIPFVFFGVARYLYLVYHKNVGGNPSEVLYRDRPILLTLVLWVLAVFLILFP